MFDKMSVAQRSMMLAAVGREDHILIPPANARAAALKTLADKLIDAGWARMVKARDGAPIWRKDAEGGEVHALKLTAKSLKAIAATGEAKVSSEELPEATAAEIVAANGATRSSAATTRRSAAKVADAALADLSVTATRPPRATSKLGHVLDILTAEAGATMGDLTTATGWLEHTTRAALSGLRRRGYALRLTRKERDGASVYRIAADACESAK